MEKTLSRQIRSRIKVASRKLGVPSETFTRNAVLFYLKSIKEEVDLKSEMAMWERASDEDLRNFESRL